MKSILDLYASGLSIRQCLEAFGIGEKQARNIITKAGAKRTKSQGMYLRYNPHAEPRKDDVLTIRLSWLDEPIVSRYQPIQYFTGER